MLPARLDHMRDSFDLGTFIMLMNNAIDLEITFCNNTRSNSMCHPPCYVSSFLVHMLFSFPCYYLHVSFFSVSRTNVLLAYFISPLTCGVHAFPFTHLLHMFTML